MNMLPNASYSGAGEHLFKSEEFSDLTIIVKSNNGGRWRFPAHKLILSSQSPVFRLMLENEFCERKNGEVVIEDIEPHIVEMLLMYVYCGKSVLENWLDARDLLCAAHKYQIDPLVNYCARFLESVITINNVCNIYNDACLYSLISLKEKALKLILDAGFILLRSKSFERLSCEAVMEIITSRELNIDSELMVFEALLRWAPIQCCRLNIPVSEENILKELTPFLKYVCFDDMSDTEKSALPSAVLSCVKPNNRNRVTYHVNDSLLSYSYFFNFHTEQLGPCLEDQLNCMRFSLDTSKYLLGLKFIVIVPHIPEHLTLVLVKECASTSYNAVIVNLARAVWKEALQVNDCMRWETKVLLRQPCAIEKCSVFKLYIETNIPNLIVPKTSLINKSLSTDCGVVNLSLHSDSIWGIKNLIFI
ncbi:BTB/POZ domain-containing protein 3 [Parasteatoda tepidariorum]|nr:BTB/POZ domain-containing protein 3 [Parasteatoda tepidariorum]